MEIKANMKEYDRALSASSSNVRATTLLEQCVDQQRTNADYISKIQYRINSLIGKLRGYPTKGDCGESGVRESEGLLGDHKTALNYEAERLGEIQADLAALEDLL